MRSYTPPLPILFFINGVISSWGILTKHHIAITAVVQLPTAAGASRWSFLRWRRVDDWWRVLSQSRRRFIHSAGVTL